MAEILCRATDNPPGYEKGDIIFIAEDGQPWSVTGESLPNFIRFEIPGVARSVFEFRRNRWDRVTTFTLQNQNVNGWRVEASNSAGGTSNPLTRAQIEPFLIEWGATVFSEAPNSIVFDLGIADALQSPGFWGLPDTTGLTFAPPPSRTGTVWTVTVDYAVRGSTAQQVQNRFVAVGGLVTSHTLGTVIVGDIDRVDVRNRFEAEVQKKTRDLIRKRRYAMPIADIDAAIANGGTLQMTEAEFNSKVIDRAA